MARPKLTVVVKRTQVNLSLYVGEDDDLIAFFEQLPERKRASAVKRALRQGGMEKLQTDSLEDDRELDAAIEGFI